jgi:hypothetical protein
MEWQPIETAPKDGRRIVAWRQGYGWNGWEVLRWKVNTRTGREYFGDPLENDDYDLADEQPTHWLPIPEPPRLPPVFKRFGQ